MPDTVTSQKDFTGLGPNWSEPKQSLQSLNWKSHRNKNESWWSLKDSEDADISVPLVISGNAFSWFNFLYYCFRRKFPCHKQGPLKPITNIPVGKKQFLYLFRPKQLSSRDFSLTPQAQESLSPFSQIPDMCQWMGLAQVQFRLHKVPPDTTLSSSGPISPKSLN